MNFNYVEGILKELVDYVWGLPTVFLLVLSGIMLTLYIGWPLGFIQFRVFFHAFQVVRGKFDKADDPGEISHFQALTTALSATVGLGNIGIVAIIIKLGGPGAIFWMILTGFFGMATKFCEASLAQKFRHIDSEGKSHGGPMYYIEKGLGSKFKALGIFYALAITIGSFGISNLFQSNQAAEIFNQNFHIHHLATGIFIAILTALVIIGGIKRIGRVTSYLVPFMAVTYVLGCLIVLAYHYEKLPSLIMLILHDAFSGSAMAGGAFISVQMAMIQGVRRACFSNEAGLGSAAIAHSAAATSEPIREGAVAAMGPFIDTMVICTLSALVILATNVWQTSDLVGVPLAALAFDTVILGFGTYFIPVAAFLFAFSTMIAWYFYGESALYYLSGKKHIRLYQVTFCLVAIVGSVWSIKPVLDFSDIMTGLMIFPNLLAIWLLSKSLKKDAMDYFSRY